MGQKDVKFSDAYLEESLFLSFLMGPKYLDILGYLYDEDIPHPPSVDNWHEVTQSPSYYIYREGCDLFSQYSSDIASHCAGVEAVIDLGPGTSKSVSQKTLPILKELPNVSTYIPMDISRAYTEDAQQTVRNSHPNLAISPEAGDIFNPQRLKQIDMQSLYIFAGAALINTPEPNESKPREKMQERLQTLRGAMPKESLLLIEYDTNLNGDEVVAAYKNPAVGRFVKGIISKTASVLNLPELIPDKFTYTPQWDSKRQCVEHIIRPVIDIPISFGSEVFNLRPHHQLHVGSSNRITNLQMSQMGSQSGFEMVAHYPLPAKRMALSLMRAA